MRKRLQGALALLLLVSLVAACTGQKAPAGSDEKVPTVAELLEKQDEAAAATVDTSKFKKGPPWKIGVSAGYLTNSWVVFTLAEIQYEASKNPDIEEVIVTDANFQADKQIADIESLLNQDIDILIYWPVDDAAAAPALQKAVDKGVATVQAGGGFMGTPEVTHSVFVDQVRIGEMVARQLVKDMGDKGDIVAMLPIAGSSAAVDQLAALKAVLAENPGINLLSAEYGDWNRAKAKSITENLLQKHPKIDGVFSPAGQMSIGMAEAFEEAGRLQETVFSPGDDYNGWLKWVHANKMGGVVTFPRCGAVALQQAVKILKGEPVPKGLRMDSEYWSPTDIAGGKGVELDRPDDWWPSTLPAEFLPKQ